VATVVVAGRHTDRLARTVKDIEAEGVVGRAIVADIGHGPDAANLVAETVRRYGRLDTTRYGQLDTSVNNAGVL
jgi:NAD(P)-dependent dehydrogenase (short-subunit alcohol dehydrogenase family)